MTSGAPKPTRNSANQTTKVQENNGTGGANVTGNLKKCEDWKEADAKKNAKS